MKRAIFSTLLLISALCATAKEPSQYDTIPVDNARITKVVEDVTTNKKGKKVTKYYFIYNGELVTTSSRVVEMYNLSRKHGAKCHLSVVVNKETGKKRIITH